jgi:hypothetical protein
MLDYAANGVVYWPLEQLRELHARQCERDNKDPNVVVAEVAGDETGSVPATTCGPERCIWSSSPTRYLASFAELSSF